MNVHRSLYSSAMINQPKNIRLALGRQDIGGVLQRKRYQQKNK
jgi:hypothetical protein